MLFVNDVNGKNYAVKFFHVINEADVKPHTTCEIYSVDSSQDFGKSSNPKLEASGRATLGQGDTYSRNTGRYVAFRRALLELPRPIRQVFWDVYMMNCNMPVK